jgi:hypothetical protein
MSMDRCFDRTVRTHPQRLSAIERNATLSTERGELLRRHAEPHPQAALADADDDGEAVRVYLPSGRYQLLLRYYECGAGVAALPEVKVRATEGDCSAMAGELTTNASSTRRDGPNEIAHV